MRIPAHAVTGTGEPLLLLSPYAVPASTLDRVKAPFLEHFTCITFDYPGSGVARSPLLPITIPGLAASAISVLDHLGYPSAHVYGMSMGGLVAQEMAIRFPERVRGLVLSATTPGGHRATRPDLWTLMAAMSSMKSRVDVPSNPRILGSLYQGYAAMLHDTSTRLDRIQARTLIIHGQQDRLVPVPNAHLLHAGVHGSSIRILPSGSHFYAFDDPDGSAAVVLNWLKELVPSPAGESSGVRRNLASCRAAVVLPVAGARATCTAGRIAFSSLQAPCAWLRFTARATRNIRSAGA